MPEVTFLCAIEGCDKPEKTKRLCSIHYWQHRRDELAKAACTVEGCGRPLFCKGLCRGHYARRQRGATEEQLRTKLAQQGVGRVRYTVTLTKEAAAALNAQVSASGLTANVLLERAALAWLGIP